AFWLEVFRRYARIKPRQTDDERLASVAPMDGILDTRNPTYHARTFWDVIPGFRVNPPRNEFIKPPANWVIVWNGIARPTDVRNNAARRSISREHIPELDFVELFQLVPTYEWYLRTVPIETVIHELHMTEADFIAMRWKRPRQLVEVGLRNTSKQLDRFIPQRSLIRDHWR